MVKYTVTVFSIILLMIFITPTINAAEITATVDRNPIPVGESFQFILDANGSIDEDPDFSELRKVFRILNTSQSSNIRFINGSITRNKIWTMVMIADSPGNYIIPAISFGQDKSDPISIKIIENTATLDHAQQAEIYIDIDVEPKSVYVQQQIIYTIKLYRRIQLSNASLSEPVSENNQAIITKLGEDQDKRIAINGVSYQVLERRYAIFPQKRGKLRILPITFETQIVRNTRQRSFFNMDPFNARIKRLKSKAVEINIKSIPAAFTKKYPNAAWLPVDKLTITDSWSDDIKSFKSGEPITRTIRLTAQNLSAAQLPDIKFNTPSNMKTYPDVPVTSEQNNNKGLVANKEFKVALLPTKAGKNKLSKIVIPWWNTNTNRIEEASLSALTIKVNSSVDQRDRAKIDLDNSVAVNRINKASTNEDTAVIVKSNEESRLEHPDLRVWIILSVIFLVLWLLTSYLLLRLRSKYKLLHAVTNLDTVVHITKPVSIKLIKKACMENDATRCSQYLLQWANYLSRSEQFTNLSSLLPYASKELSIAIEELQYALYGQKTTNWNGSALWSAFNANQPIFASVNKHDTITRALPSLYASYK